MVVAGSGRDPFFDNVRVLAVMLIAGQGAIAGLRKTVPSGHALWMFVGVFAMPLLIMLSGYLSQEFSFEKRKAQRLITGILVPYLLFEVAYSLFDWHFGGRSELRFSLLDPYGVTWFLMALFFWRLSTPVWQQIRWPLAVSVVFALLCYCGPLSHQLDMHRIFGLTPFYVLGLKLRPEHFALLRSRGARPAGFLILIGGLLLAFPAKDHLGDGWFVWRESNQTLAAGELTGTVLRLALYGAAVILAAAFLAVVPRSRTFFTGLGTTAIFGYLLHWFFVRFAAFQGWDNALHLRSFPAMALLFCAGALFTAVLCTPPIVKATRWAVQPDLTWAFKKS
ncbi:acyltransferase family protein [Actinocorallia lasiicapitis]